jgi:hypothetical protein
MKTATTNFHPSVYNVRNLFFPRSSGTDLNCEQRSGSSLCSNTRFAQHWQSLGCLLAVVQDHQDDGLWLFHIAYACFLFENPRLEPLSLVGRNLIRFLANTMAAVRNKQGPKCALQQNRTSPIYIAEALIFYWYLTWRICNRTLTL